MPPDEPRPALALEPNPALALELPRGAAAPLEAPPELPGWAAPSRRRRRFGIFFWIGLLVSLACGVVVAGSSYGYWLLHKAVGQIRRVPDLRTAPEVEGQPVTYVIVGSDSRDAPQFEADRLEGVGGQRADVIIVVILDPRRQAAVMLSIPRDTRVEIPGYGLEKINAAYYEGPQLMVDTVSLFTGLAVNHYVEVDFLGFMQLVDAVGKVPLCTDRTLTDEYTGLYLPAGCHELDGGAALPYVRSRHTMIEVSPGEFVEDPTADFGRIQRQQQFLRALLSKVARPVNAPRFPGYVSAVSDTVRADPSFGEGDALGLARRFLRFDPRRIYMLSLPGVTTGGIGGVSYVLPTEATDAFLAALRDGLPLPGEPGYPVALADVPVVVTNGNGIEGCASVLAARLIEAGAQVLDVGTSSRTDVPATELRHNPGDREKAEVVRGALGYGTPVEVNRPGPEVEVLVGADAAVECGA